MEVQIGLSKMTRPSEHQLLAKTKETFVDTLVEVDTWFKRLLAKNERLETLRT